MENVTEEDYLRMVGHKTGALVAASCASGALVGAGADEEKAIATALDYGEAIGIAYQIQDDVMDFLGTKILSASRLSPTLNPEKSDLMLIHLLEHCSEEEKRFVHSLIGEGLIESMDTEKIAQHCWTKYESSEYARQCCGPLMRKKPNPFLDRLDASQARNRLMELSEFLVHRYLSFKRRSP